MKRLVFLLAILASVYTTQAQTQAEEFGIAVSAGYLTEIEGFGGSFDLIYNITDKFGVSTTATYSVGEPVPGLRNKWLALDLNGRYKLYDEFYVLAGGEYLSITLKGLGLGGGDPLGSTATTTDAEFGYNLGAGYKYNLIDNVNIFTEVKYVGVETGYIHAKLGILFDL